LFFLYNIVLQVYLLRPCDADSEDDDDDKDFGRPKYKYVLMLWHGQLA